MKPYILSPTFTSVPKNNFQGREFTDEQGGIKSVSLLKKGIWLYFLLLIFEGALRKWFLPGLATPLLIIRDPLTLWIVLLSWKRGLLTFNPYLIGILLIGIAGIYTATLLGHRNLLVALYGARVLLLHFPLMFVIGHTFDREDVINVGKALLAIAIPMLILIAVQFYSPQSAWVNRGVGGDMEGAGFSGSLGFFRPPGTFSFTNGNSLFFGFVASYVLYFWLDNKALNKLLLIAATVALILSISFSISRTLFFEVSISIIFAMIACIRNPKYLSRMLFAVIGGGIALVLLSQTNFLLTATEAFTSRFENANESEGGLEGVVLDRFLGGLIEAITGASEIPFFGYGLGMGTNVGSMLLTGSRTFLISEGEWGRVIGELGPIMGIGVILIRIGFAAKLAIASISKISQGNLLPWMLLSFGFLNISQAQWAQPTSLGFSTLIGGLILASLKSPSIETKNSKVCFAAFPRYSNL